MVSSMPTVMTMTPSMSDDPWVDINKGPDSWVGRRFPGEHCLAPFWAVHPNGAPGVVVRGIPVSSVPNDLPKPRGIALGIDTDVVDAGLATLTMFLQTPEDRDVFQRLCEDIVVHSSTAMDQHDAGQRVFNRLRRWQSLLGLARGREMSDQEVRGLIAELWMLVHHLQPRMGLASALRTWVAPERHPQDFALPNGVLELKARITGSRTEVRISSLEQLERSELPLHLVVVELAPAEQGDVHLSLNDMAARLLDDAQAEGSTIAELAYKALANRGYMAASKYDDLRYSIVGVTVFEVTPDFPRILRGSTDVRIREANYSLILTTLGEYARDLGAVLAMGTAALAGEIQENG